jgi:hypothetical protein
MAIFTSIVVNALEKISRSDARKVALQFAAGITKQLLTRGDANHWN